MDPTLNLNEALGPYAPDPTTADVAAPVPKRGAVGLRRRLRRGMKLLPRTPKFLIDMGTEMFWLAIVIVGLTAVGVGVYRDICDWTK